MPGGFRAFRCGSSRVLDHIINCILKKNLLKKLSGKDNSFTE